MNEKFIANGEQESSRVDTPSKVDGDIDIAIDEIEKALHALKKAADIQFSDEATNADKIATVRKEIEEAEDHIKSSSETETMKKVEEENRKKTGYYFQ